MALLLATTARNALANGIDRNGAGAQSMAMGGTETAWAADPLGAMYINPAGLGFLQGNELDLGGVGGLTDGSFNRGAISGSLGDSPNALPEGAIGIPLKVVPVTIGLAVIPDSLLLADWSFVDPPSTPGGVSYGLQQHKSEILALRSALGAGVQITPQVSLGASVGLVYNKNQLVTPYTFQSYPTVKGAKTLLDLNTDGFGVNAEAGVLYRPLTNLQFGLSYKSPSRVYSSGSATGDPYAQFGAPPGPLAFHYDAQVRNIFPQQVSGGVSWGFLPKWRVAAQVDWINWADAFKTLPVSLSNGSNPTVNAVVGTSAFQDNIPLNWRNEAVYRVGLEYEVIENLSLRAGYSYGGSPVPDSTLTPMTAAVSEHTITAGVGYRWKCCQIDLAYQCDLPASRSVGATEIVGGEYANSTTDVTVHWLAVTLGIHF